MLDTQPHNLAGQPPVVNSLAVRNVRREPRETGRQVTPQPQRPLPNIGDRPRSDSDTELDRLRHFNITVSVDTLQQYQQDLSSIRFVSEPKAPVGNPRDESRSARDSDTEPQEQPRDKQEVAPLITQSDRNPGPGKPPEKTTPNENPIYSVLGHEEHDSTDSSSSDNISKNVDVYIIERSGVEADIVIISPKEKNTFDPELYARQYSSKDITIKKMVHGDGTHGKKEVVVYQNDTNNHGVNMKTELPKGDSDLSGSDNEFSVIKIEANEKSVKETTSPPSGNTEPARKRSFLACLCLPFTWCCRKIFCC